MKKKIIYSMFIFSKDITYSIAEEWCKTACKFFIPNKMSGVVVSRGKNYKYNEKKFYDSLDKEINNGIGIRLSDSENMIWITQDAQRSNITNLTILVEAANTSEVDRLIDKLMVQNGIVAYKCSLDDDVFQNTLELSDYIDVKGSLDGVKTIKSKIGPDREIVDIEYNPGHSHRARGIWFGSCYRMWFGKSYYQYIAKEKLKKFKNCYENKELDGDVIRITLYEDMWDYEHEHNREIQWGFRKSVGMDDVAHALENIDAKEQGADGAIEILIGNFPNGGTRVINYYFDSEDYNVSKFKAVKMRTYEFSEEGKVLYYEEKKL